MKYGSIAELTSEQNHLYDRVDQFSALFSSGASCHFSTPFCAVSGGLCIPIAFYDFSKTDWHFNNVTEKSILCQSSKSVNIRRNTFTIKGQSETVYFYVASGGDARKHSSLESS